MMSVDETLLCSFQVSPRHSSSPTLLSGRAFADPLLVSVDPETGREEEDVRVRRSRSGSPGYSATQGEGRQDQVNRFAWPPLPSPSRGALHPFVVPRREISPPAPLTACARCAPPCLAFVFLPRIVFVLPPPPSPFPPFCVCVCLSPPVRPSLFVVRRCSPAFPPRPHPPFLPLSLSLSSQLFAHPLIPRRRTCPRPAFCARLPPHLWELGSPPLLKRFA
jgi:hypothetical protein